MVTLSKSKYIIGKQCTKLMYLDYHKKSLEITPDNKGSDRMKVGTEVGLLAQNLFPGGVNTDYFSAEDKTRAVELTKKYIEEGEKIIYEAAFEFNNLLVFADILVRDNDKWKIYEVKASTKIKNYYYSDTAFQYYVINNSGLDIEDIFIIHLNNKYRRIGELDINQLFTIVSVKDKILPAINGIDKEAEVYKNILDSAVIPDIKIGTYCNVEPQKPCSFHSYCWKDIPDYSIFNVGYLKKRFDLYYDGIIDIKDLPLQNLNDNQLIEVKSYIDKTIHINKDAIKDFLNQIKYPLYFFDFETIMPAVPEFDYSYPYQQIPFQYSLHYRESKNSELKHESFLAESLPDLLKDSRKELILKLLNDTKGGGTILAYWESFEKVRLDELSRDFPEFENELIERNSRIIDLCEPFRNKWYYKHEMRGRFSIKSVLPAICPDLTYDNLEVQDGLEAGREFLKLRTVNDENERQSIRKNLLAYCERDTYAMVVLLEELYKCVIVNDDV